MGAFQNSFVGHAPKAIGPVVSVTEVGLTISLVKSRSVPVTVKQRRAAAFLSVGNMATGIGVGHPQKGLIVA